MLSKAQIKYIQALQHKKYRQKSRQFTAEGDKIVQELLRDGRVLEVYATADWVEEQQVLLAQLPSLRLEVVEPPLLKQLSALTTPNRAMALLDIPPAAAPGPLNGTIALALETIQDPGNMGTIIRIADWFGIPQIICSPDCVDAYNPKTIQATMGSIARVQIIESDIIPFLQQANVASYAATLHGRDITEFDAIKEGILLIGNESRGLSDAVLEHCTYRITIPRLGGAESLNAAVAAGIICGRMLLG
ncbi:RNA methyltransferase [Chitinophaga agrisoli]|uniref:RNA methyltransferase n=1 Tax=Chitinophaga agrisoli TaxID=2607653 RepID=A0A5B2VTK2_9BACT|nr:RNA methyltransferase [Chitinophaga agrisoli]KAA2241616.1 RNA methyltransferase [Chitinophaga agrisoli]